jgi:putative flippase GtrA
MLTALYRDHAVRAIGIVHNPVVLWLLTIVFGLYYVTSQEMGIGVAMLWSFGGDQWQTWEHHLSPRVRTSIARNIIQYIGRNVYSRERRSATS